MKTLLSQLGDHTRAEFVQYCQLYPVPDYVKQAAVDDVFSVPEGSLDFADRLNRDFPLHTKAATYVSCLYFMNKQAGIKSHDLDRVADRIQKAANFWEIADDVRALQDAHVKLAEAARPSFEDDDYAFVGFDAQSGQKVQRLRIANTKEVRAAADWLMKNRDVLSYGDRRTMAEKILTKQEEYGADLSDHRTSLNKIAGRGFCQPEDAVRILRDRASLLPGAKVKLARALNEAADRIQKNADWLPTSDDLEMIAKTIDGVDRDAGLHVKYAYGLRRPEEVLFQTDFEAVEEAYEGLVKSPSGSIYKKADLLRIPVEDIENALGREFAEHVCVTPIGPRPELFAKVAEMPLDQEDRLAAVLRKNKISPVRDARPKRATVLTPGEWKQLAGV
jgi:hypothetical protein